MARFRDIKTLQKFLPLPMPRSTTTSTTNAISPAATFSNNAEPPLYPSGANCQPDSSQEAISQDRIS